MTFRAFFLVVPVLACGSAIGAQTLQVRPISASPTLASRCAEAPDAHSDPAWRLVRSALAHPGDADRDPALATLQDSVEEVLAREPDRTADRHLLAVILGARSEVASGRAKLEWAGAMREQTLRILEQEPDHPGAHHLLGRLHAAVERMGSVKRFLARAIVGGDALEGASWDSARRHLTRAARDAPCQAEYHFELARLHEDLGEAEEAWAEARHVIELAGDSDEGRQLRERAMRLVERLPMPRALGSSRPR